MPRPHNPRQPDDIIHDLVIARQLAGLSVDTVAHMMNADPKLVEQIESLDVNPYLTELAAYADAVDCTIALTLLPPAPDAAPPATEPADLRPASKFAHPNHYSFCLCDTVTAITDINDGHPKRVPVSSADYTALTSEHKIAPTPQSEGIIADIRSQLADGKQFAGQ